MRRRILKSPSHRAILSIPLLAAALLALVHPASAGTLAYWRMEGDGVSTPVAGSTQVLDTNNRTTTNTTPGIVIVDVSGNGNTVWAWQHTSAGHTYQSSVPATKVTLTGVTNQFSIQNAGAAPACFTWSKYSLPAVDLETVKPLAWTIEASIRPTTIDATHRTFVGRDGNGVASDANLAPLYFKTFPGGLLEITFVDEGGRAYTVRDATALTVNTWYNMAAVSDGATLKLFKDSGAGYQLIGSTALTSGDTRLAYDDSGSTSPADTQWGWTLGRGRYGTSDLQGDNHVDRWLGNIDEVRISDAALKPSELLFAPTNVYVVSGPTPASQAVAPGSAASFNIVPGGQNPRLQWRFNGTNILNATNETHAILSAAAESAGNYDVVITNSFGSAITSSVATLTVTAPTLAHRYSFASDASDSVGGAAWNGTLQNGATIAGGQLVLSSAASNYLTLPGQILSNFTAVTIEAWATFTNQLPANCFFFGFGRTNGNSGDRYIFCAPQAGRIAITDGNYTGEQSASGAGDFSYRANLHVTAIYNPPSGYLAIYTNGALAGVNTAVTVPLSAVSNVLSYIGRSLYNGDPYPDLSLDEFRIYSGALTPQRIAMNTAAGPDSFATNGPGALTGWTLKVRPHVSLGNSQLANVLANYAGGLSNFNLTANSPLPVSGLTLTSSNPGVVGISGYNLTALAPGTSLITAVYQGITNSVTMTVYDTTFGFTTSGGYYAVDTGAGLVFKVEQSSGDITSIRWAGTGATELQYQLKGSHIDSGLGSPTTCVLSDSGDTILITVNSPAVTHYMMVRRNVNVIHMATYLISGDGNLRWITRLNGNVFTNVPPASNTEGSVGAVEGSDVFYMADGTTRSKFYGNDRTMELGIKGSTGPGLGVFMYYGSRESGSGGPFWRDIQFQGTGEIYTVPCGQHAMTEAQRVNVLNGPYALVFNYGEAPPQSFDFSWIEPEGLNLTGWVGPGARGAVKGVAWGIPTGYQGVVKFANTTAQYWAVVGTNGTYLTQLMKPGTYAVTLCKGELEVATNIVTVIAGQTNTLHLGSTETAPDTVFRIGDWDGKPRGFLNADLITNMHPTDVRMNLTNWQPGFFTVGVDPLNKFPMMQCRDLGTNLITVQFVLTANQIQNLRLRYGLTISHMGGRPKPTINAWSPANPVAPREIDTRGLTRGTWRGFNDLYTFDVPSSAFIVGTNYLYLSIISGETGFGGWLSPACGYDAVELSVPNTSPALPAAPDNLAATVVNSSQVALSWRDNSTNEVNFLIERSTDSTNYTLVAAVLAGVTNYTDSGLVLAENNVYRVRAFNAGGYSRYTGESLPPLPTLVHRYSFNETSGTIANDSIGGAAWNGTLPSGGTFGGGKLTLAAASSQHVNLPANILSNYTAVTIEAWATFPNAIPWNTMLFAFGNKNGAEGINYLFCSPQSGRIAITSTNWSGEQNAYSGIDFSLRTNLHVTAVFHPAENYLEIYTSGVLAGINTGVIVPLNAVSNVFSYIGRSLYSGDTYFNVSLDEFRIYNGAMQAVDVAAAQIVGPSVLLTANPALSASSSGGNLTLTWPVAGSGFTLESSPTLGAGAVWTPMSVTPSVVGLNNQVTITPTSGTLFFRLRR